MLDCAKAPSNNLALGVEDTFFERNELTNISFQQVMVWTLVILGASEVTWPDNFSGEGTINERDVLGHGKEL